MSVRVLTIDEMLALPEGAEALYLGNKAVGDEVEGLEGLEPMSTITKKKDIGNDIFSVAFNHSESYDFFYEGEVGVVEPLLYQFHVHNSGVDMDISTGRPTKEIVEELGIFRPELETRKIGKVSVELVDDGFPLALREIAQVMSWAAVAKGYLPHDWQNLPNAEVALAAAASRHRTDHIKQRVVDGLDIDECVDVESGLLHKAHEAFGVLAQLELMLRGKFVDSRPQIGV